MSLRKVFRRLAAATRAEGEGVHGEMVTVMASGREVEMTGEESLVHMARLLMADKARDNSARITMTASGRITVSLSDGSKVNYLTDVDTSIPIVRAE